MTGRYFAKGLVGVVVLRLALRASPLHHHPHDLAAHLLIA